MLKKTTCLLLPLALACATTVQAQYTQMIVDDRNQLMPIFFDDPAMQQQALAPTPVSIPSNMGGQQRYPGSSPSIVRAPPPQPSIRPVSFNRPVAPPVRTASRPAQRKPSNPLTGPYFISSERHRIMDAAYAALGIPYKYGGNNPARGLDCSSLMQFIYKRALNTKLPRTAAQQRDNSKTLAFQNLQPGDMLFFKINPRTNHVGVYIGNGKFIHASSGSRKAVIASMNLPYWKKRFVKFGSYLES